MVIGETMITVRKLGMAAMVVMALTLAACTTSAVGLAYSTDAHPHVRWIDMTSAAGRAWLLGTYPCSNRTCYVILRSDDGGSTWVRVGAPPVRSTSGTMIEVYLDSLTFANRDDGYAYGDDPSFGQTYWSHDGGETWHRLRHPGIFASPIITTQGHAYGLIYKGNPDIPISTPSSDSVTFVLASSLVTSGTWTMRPLPILGEDNGVSVAAYGFEGVADSDQERWWLCAAACIQRWWPELFKFSKSRDWEARLAPLRPLLTRPFGASVPPAARATRFARPTVGGTSCPCHLVPRMAAAFFPVSDDEAIFQAPTFPSLFLTRDGGAHFRSVLRSQKLSGGFDTAVASTTTWVVLGLSPIGGINTMWRTTDGGRSWQRVSPPGL